MSADTSHLRARISAWVAETFANRSSITDAPDTILYMGRVRGLPSVGALGSSEAICAAELRDNLTAYAERLVSAGHELPTWDRPMPEVNPAMVALVRMSTLRRLLKERAAQWGALRDNLPAGVCERFLADLDQLLTRHAISLSGTLQSPPKNEKGGAA